MARALFLDRDGTLIEDTGYVRRVSDVRLLDGVREALTSLSTRYRLVLVSNQSGVGRGLLTESDLDAVHRRMLDLLSPIELAGAFYCVHAPYDHCVCRKPRPGLLINAARELGLDLATSVMVGDRSTDIAAGDAAGCQTALLGAAVDREPQPRYVGATWAELARMLP